MGPRTEVALTWSRKGDPARRWRRDEVSNRPVGRDGEIGSGGGDQDELS